MLVCFHKGHLVSGIMLLWEKLLEIVLAFLMRTCICKLWTLIENCITSLWKLSENNYKVALYNIVVYH